MPKKKTKRGTVDLTKVRILVAELREVADEFDASDPGLTEVVIDQHISTLVNKKVLKVPRMAKHPKILDVFSAILKNHTTDDILERVQTFQDLVNSYRGDPSTDDMEEAESVLQEMIDYLDGMVAERS